MIIDLKNCTIRFKGGGVGQRIDVKLGAGNLTFSEKKPREYHKDRGALDTVRDGEEEPMDVKVDGQWEFITGLDSSDITPVDAVKRKGGASDWDSTSPDDCEPYAIDIEIIQNPPCGEDNNEIATFPEFRYESIDFDAKAGTISFTGKCNATEAITNRGVSSS